MKNCPKCGLIAYDSVLAHVCPSEITGRMMAIIAQQDGELATMRRLLCHILAMPAVRLTLPEQLRAQAELLAHVVEGA